MLNGLFLSVPMTAIWQGLKYFSGVPIDDDTPLREIYPQGVASGFLLTAIPLAGFTGLLFCVAHHPFTILPPLVAAGFVLPLKWLYRSSLTKREGWRPEFLTNK